MSTYRLNNLLSLAFQLIAQFRRVMTGISRAGLFSGIFDKAAVQKGEFGLVNSHYAKVMGLPRSAAWINFRLYPNSW